jgi:hypothetical protein
MPAFLRLIAPANGISRIKPLAVPDSVSVKTAVITYVPDGVEAVVFTISAPDE